jgi:hypothetical protein
VKFQDILGLSQSQLNLVNPRSKNRKFQFSEMITFSGDPVLKYNMGLKFGGNQRLSIFGLFLASKISWDLALFWKPVLCIAVGSSFTHSKKFGFWSNFQRSRSLWSILGRYLGPT